MVVECNRCKSAGFPNQIIDFEKIGQDPITAKNIWKLLNKDGTEHEHKHRPINGQQQQQHGPNNNTKKDSIRICWYCNKEITFHEDTKTPSGKKIPLNRDNSIHDCLLNPFNQAKQGRS